MLAALLYSPFLCNILLRPTQRLCILAWLVPMALTALAIIISINVYDTSYDGMTYDADAILQLLKGYNPYYDRLDSSHDFYNFWVNHYAKATWSFSAVVAHATGFYQAGKCYHMLLAFAAAFYVYDYFRMRGVSQLSALLLAGAVAANPVIIDQMFSYYVDGAIAGLFILLLFATLNLLSRSRRVDRLVFIMAACLFINVKFTAPAYLFVLCLIALRLLTIAGHN